MLGGRWAFHGCDLRCGHGSALRTEADARVALSGCRLGGEGKLGRVHLVEEYGTIQLAGLRKRACYGVHASAASRVALTGCRLVSCSEAGVFLRDRAEVTLRDSALADVGRSFLAGVGGGARLECSGTSVSGRALWTDADRPDVYVWPGSERDGGAGGGAEEADGEAGAAAAGACSFSYTPDDQELMAEWESMRMTQVEVPADDQRVAALGGIEGGE